MFEWNNEKSTVNKGKHEISFEEATKLWDDHQGIILLAKTVDEEERAMLVAKYNEKIWPCIYTIRGEKIRIISARRSRENEEALYEKNNQA